MAREARASVNRRAVRAARSAADARDVLLVGGDGFLGSAIARLLLAEGRRVTTLSRGHHAPVPGAERLIADRRDARSLASLLRDRRFDLTVDLAAYDALDVEALWKVPGASLGRTILVSTGQVYLVTETTRRVHREPDSRKPVRREPAAGAPDHAQWSYGVGKRRAEAAFAALRRHHGVRGTVLRLPVIHGEADPTLRLWAWLERMLDGGPVILPDGGRRATRFVEVQEVARLVARIAAGLEPPEAVYNLAAARPTSLARFLALAARAAEREPRFVAIPMPTLVAHGLDPRAWPYAGRWSSVLDPSRAKRDLGWTGGGPEEWLPRVVRWHLEHRRDESDDFYTQRPAELAALAAIGAEGAAGARLTVAKRGR